MEKIFTNGSHFTDDLGRERIFNGINYVNKGKKKFLFSKKKKYKFKFDEKLMKKLKELGFNIVRLGIIWDAVEPEPNVYNENYLKEIDKIVYLCEKYEMYFFLDLHQDLFGKIGDGAPDWACLSKGYKFKRSLFIWAEGYFYSNAVQKSFDSFWENEQVNGKGLQDYYCDMIKYVSARYCNSPAFFGFDFFNEPYPGSDGKKVFTNIVEETLNAVNKTVKGKNYKKFNAKKCFENDKEKLGFLKLVGKIGINMFSVKKIKALKEIFGNKKSFHNIVVKNKRIIKNFDENVYTPFLNKCAKALRSVTDKGVLLMENSYYSNLGIPYSALPVSVDGKMENNVAFAPHGYDLFVDSPFYRYASNGRADSIFEEHAKSQERLEMPVIVGEWGGYTFGKKWVGHIEHLIEFFNNKKWSTVYWCYADKVLKSPVINALSRPYPQKVCGKIIDFKYNKNSNIFELNFEQSTNFNSDSIAYLHRKPKKINSDCDCSFEEYAVGNCGVLKIKSDIGKHFVKVEF